MNVKRDQLLATVTGIVGTVMYLQATNVRELKFDVLGNRLFPIMASILIIIFSVGLFIQSTFFTRQKATDTWQKKVKLNFRTLIFGLLFVGYVFLLKYSGFVVASSVFSVAAVLLVQGQLTVRKIVLASLYSFISAFAIWYVFEKLLGLLLP